MSLGVTYPVAGARVRRPPPVTAAVLCPQTVVDEWLETYRRDRERGFLELANFIVRSCGCRGWGGGGGVVPQGGGVPAAAVGWASPPPLFHRRVSLSPVPRQAW